MFASLRRTWWLPSLVCLSALLTAEVAFAQAAANKQPQAADESARIVEILERQADAWNRGDIVEFMEVYWKDDRLTFSSGGRTMRGWKATLERYQKSYPKEKMGQLHFSDISCELLSPDAALVLGDWHLDLAGEKKDGNFSLVLRKLEGRWLIVHDHSSALTDEK